MSSHDIYMDFNATAPVRPEAAEVFARVQRDCPGNASSAHSAGRRAKAELDRARETLAATLGARASEIVFTSGGTESDNLAIKGIAGVRGAGHVITSTVEHPAVAETCRYLEERGGSVTRVGVGRDGAVDAETVRDAIRDDTILITLMWVNNETGVIQPVDAVAQIAREHEIVFHTDAVQAIGRTAIDMRLTGAGLLSLSGHKFGAPKGIGVLVVRRGIELDPFHHGGGQERNRRSGTYNVPAAAALARAAELASAERVSESERIGRLLDRIENTVRERVPRAFVNGSGDRVANTSNLRFDGADGEGVVLALDSHGIATSSASACAASHDEPSHVLTAMGLSRAQAENSIRVSLGHSTTDADVDRFLDVIPQVVSDARRSVPPGRPRAL